MEKSSFIHVGLTVSDIQKTIDFYEKYFEFKIDRRFRFPQGFFDAKPTLYKLYEGAFSDAAMISSPDGVTLELFQFDRQNPAQEPVWNTPGYHHICLKVADVHAKYEEMTADGIEFFFKPDFKGPPENNEFWVFLKDPDGNMIELQ